MTLGRDPDLTEAAASALEEYTTDLSHEVRAKALELARAAGEEHVGAGTLFRAVTLVEQSRRARSRQGRRVRSVELGSTLYVALGVLTIIAAASSYILQDPGAADWPAIAGLTGLLLSALGLLAPRLYALREVEPDIRPSHAGGQTLGDQVVAFLVGWREFERALFSARLTPGGPVDLRKYSLSQKLSKVSEAGLLSSAEVLEVRGVLARRNKLVHQGESPDPHLLQQDLATLDRLTRKLQRTPAGS